MDINKYQVKIKSILQKYKYAILILIIGLALMLLPNRSEVTEVPKQKETIVQQASTVQKELEEVLSCIQGAGKVKVMLTVGAGEETVYQKEEDISVSDSASSTKTQVITVTDSDRNETGLIRQINPPQYLGAIILCQGADDPALKLAISHAVSKIIGLGTDKIAVLKMK